MSDFCGEHTTGRDRVPGGFRGGDFQDVENAPKRGVVEEGSLASNEAGQRCFDEIADAGGCDAAAEDATNVLGLRGAPCRDARQRTNGVDFLRDGGKEVLDGGLAVGKVADW